MRFVLAVLVAFASLGFDHARHETAVAGLACDRCHAVHGGKVARPDHAACFGECHGAAPRRAEKIATDRRDVCVNCHAVGKPAVVAYAPGTDFAVVSDHKLHHDVPCAQCHAQPGKTTTPTHARCAGCHDGRGHPVAMTACTSCHVAASPSAPPVLAVTFSHASHAAHDKREPCSGCHVALTDGAVPRPTTAMCAACHDGKRAFAVTEACTRCHREAPVTKYTVIRPLARFSHAVHQVTRCATCHKLVPSGEVASAGHAPCATAGCHADDFGKPEPTTCGACHNGTEPWRHLVADRLPADATEFGATLDHDKHPAPCASCHRLRTASQALRPPRGHAACASAGCHANTSGPAPQLSACEGCHALGRFATRLAARTEAPWSARASFDHAAHTRTTEGGELACTQCHTSLTGDATTLPTPAKATCAPCHDGAAAFKLTGTTCGRCHRPL